MGELEKQLKDKDTVVAVPMEEYTTRNKVLGALDGWVKYDILNQIVGFIDKWAVRKDTTVIHLCILVCINHQRYHAHAPRAGTGWHSKEFNAMHGYTHTSTSVYYPQSNGKIELCHKSFKDECHPAQWADEYGASQTEKQYLHRLLQ